MNEESISKKRHVEKLDNFPYPNYAALCQAVRKHDAAVRVERTFASELTAKGVYVTKKHKVVGILTRVLSFIIPISLTLYSIIAGQWFLLLSLPLFIVGFSLFLQVNPRRITYIRYMISLICILALAVGIYSTNGWLTVLTSSLLLYYTSYYMYYHIPVKESAKYAIGNENILCLWWEGNVLSVILKNGNMYMNCFKCESGKTYYYTERE